MDFTIELVEHDGVRLCPLMCVCPYVRESQVSMCVDLWAGLSASLSSPDNSQSPVTKPAVIQDICKMQAHAKASFNGQKNN